jgi:outer membrane protein assembly factor BamB
MKMQSRIDKAFVKIWTWTAFKVALLILLIMADVAGSDWPQFQRDESHFGLCMDEVPTKPQILWSADLLRADVTPIISCDKVYVLSGNGLLSALDKMTGELLWQSQMEGWVFQTSTPACSGDSVFAATDSGILEAFNASSGRRMWSRNLTNKRFEGPLTYSEGRIYLGEGSAYGKALKRYFCFDEIGDEIWNVTRNTTGYQWCGACTSGEYIIFGENDGHILSVNRESGSLVDELNLSDRSRLSFARSDHGRIRASVSCHENHVYTTSESSSDNGYAWKIGFDPRSGRFENRGWSSFVGFSTSAPVAANGRVYLGTGEHGHSGKMVCLDDTSGEEIWSYFLPAGVKASPALSGKGDQIRICFTTAQVNGSIFCLEDTGDKARLIWELNPPDEGYILGGVAISDGLVYFGTEGGQKYGKLYCLSEGPDEVKETAFAQASQSLDWPQFHGCPEHTGASPSMVPIINRTAWVSNDLGAQPGSSVSVAEGKVYVNCVRALICLDQHTGKAIWKFPFEPAGDYAFGFTPIYHNGCIFFSADRSYCLNASDGGLIWSFRPPTGGRAVDGCPAADDGKVIVSDWDGHHYYCLNESIGKEMWNFTVMGNAQSTPALAQGRAVFAGWDWGQGGKIYCAGLENGTEFWNLSTKNSPCGSAAIGNGMVYMTTFNFEGDGELLAVSLENGSVIWSETVERTDSTPALAQGKVYLCGGVDGFSNLTTYCFDAATGNLVWRTPPAYRIGDWRCSPAYAQGLIFAGKCNLAEYAGLCALNASTGEPVWSNSGGGAAPAIADGLIFSIANGKVYALGDTNETSG